MAENSGISWTTHTFNPWKGCAKVSPACKNCYAERDFDHRYKQVKWGPLPNGTRVRTSVANWRKPFKWNREANRCPLVCNAAKADRVVCPGDSCDVEDGVREFQRTRVFCASLADVFEDWSGPILNSNGEPLTNATAETAGPDSRLLTMDDCRRDLFDLIDVTPNLLWLILTKRPENIRRMWADIHTSKPVFPGAPGNLGEPLPCVVRHGRRDNVWIGCSVENQEQAEKRIPELVACRNLCGGLFLSCEPLLGEVDLFGDLKPAVGGKRESEPFPAVDWVIAGGESGPGARPSSPDWFRSLRDQCEAAKVPFHFKQWGEYNENGDRVGVKKAGCMLDGQLHDWVPA